MAYLYLTEQGSLLRKTGDRLIVEKEGQVLLDVPCCKIKGVLIFGNVQFTTQAVHELFEHGIEMALLTRTGRLVGQLTSPSTKNIELRVRQFGRHDDDVFKLRLAKALVWGKLANCLHLMTNFHQNHPERGLDAAVRRLDGLRGNLDGSESLASLRGLEGTAARVYFEAFGRMLLHEFTFTGRKKRPATDPVNALLSLGYTLIFNELLSLLDGLGFDPYLGYFHEVEYGRASLACDIQEEFRPTVDRFTLYLVNNRMFGAEDFYPNPKDGAMFLKREAMKRYFGEYEKYVTREFRHPETGDTTDVRRCFRLQAEKLGRCIKGEVMYTPFALEP